MRAKKSLGQNFLRDQIVVNKIVGALNLREGETVIEIGPGTGALTETLLEEAGRVIAVEFDRDMVAVLQERFGRAINFKLVNADALGVDFASLLPPERSGQKVKLIANLPYNISTPILQRLIEQREMFSELILMFQREVVDRIIASAGGKERGFLSVMVEDAFSTEHLFDVSPRAFQPVPKVWSSVIRLKPKEETTPEPKKFRRLVSTAFMQKRKTIFNNLKSSYEDAATLLETSGIDGKRRAETLTLNEWRSLTAAVVRSGQN